MSDETETEFPMTKRWIAETIASYIHLENHAIDVAERCCKQRKDNVENVEFDDTEMSSDNPVFKVNTHHYSCGENDHDSFKLPVAMLFLTNEQIDEAYTEQLRQEREEYERQKQKRKELSDKVEKDRRREQYEKLGLEFGSPRLTEGRTMSLPEDAPEEVIEVAETLLANAKEVWPEDGEEMVSVSSVHGPWIVGPNMERFGSSMVYRDDGTWAYRNPLTGEDTAMKGGLNEALSNARCFFTG